MARRALPLNITPSIAYAASLGKAAGAFSILNPETPLRDNPIVKLHDAAIKQAFGTIRVISTCPGCGTCSPDIDARALRTTCCGSATVTARFSN